MSSNKNWTKEEERFLKRNWRLMDTPSLAEKLGRSHKAVNIKAYSLDLVSRSKEMNLKQAATILGYSYETILAVARVLGITFSKRPRRSNFVPSRSDYTYVVTKKQFNRIQESLEKLEYPKVPVRILNKIKNRTGEVFSANGRRFVLKRAKGDSFYLTELYPKAVFSEW